MVRPTVAAVIGALVAGQDPSASQVGYAVLGAVTAFASHSVKAGGRLAINASPEPFTNIGASLGEDVTVLGVIVLVLHHPWIALGVTRDAAGGRAGGAVLRAAAGPPRLAALEGSAPARVTPAAAPAVGFRAWRGWWWSAAGSAGWRAPPGWPSSATR